MSEPRFTVGSVSGYIIGRPNSRPNDAKVTSVYVFDQLYNGKIVYEARTNSRKGEQEVGRARGRAERECARLNEWWRVERARG